MRRTTLPVLCAIAALPVFPQADSQRGVRSAQTQVAYLVKPVEVAIPEFDGADQREYMARVHDIEQNALAKSNGAPIQVNDFYGPVVHTSGPVPRLVFETWSERLSRDYQESVLTGFSSIDWSNAGPAIHRFVRDNFRHVYVHYAIAADKQSGSYRLAFSSPAGHEPSDLPAPENWKAIAPVRLPAPQVVQDGDTLALDLYVDPKSGQKLVDYIHVLGRTPVHLRQDPARDSYADDAELQMTEPKLRVNGAALEPGSSSAASRHATTLSIYLPDRGTYVLSLKSRPGFDLAGEVSGNSLYFSAGADLVRIDCAARIASTGSAAYNLYVRRDDASAKPADSAHFVISENRQTNP